MSFYVCVYACEISALQPLSYHRFSSTRTNIHAGGWHWIATPDGQEIKIQRNALLVLKLPDYEEETSDSGDPVPPPVPSTSRPQRCVPSRTFISRQSLRNASLYAASLNWDDFSSMHSRSDGSMAGVRYA